MMQPLTEGYRLVEGVFGDELQGMRDAIGDCVDRVAHAMLTPFAASCPERTLEERFGAIARQDRAYAAALLQVVMADAQRDPRIALVQRHPRLSAAVAQAIAPDTASAHVVRTRAAISAFAERISPWHQDVVRPNAGTSCARVRVACWIPLGDVDADTGALEVIPGRWRGPLSHRVTPHGHFEIDAPLPVDDARVIPMRRGDVLLLDPFLPHRARPLLAAEGRWSVVMWVKTEGERAC